MNRLEQTMEDMEILKKIVNAEIDIKSVEYCQKKRILDICKQELVKLKKEKCWGEIKWKKK